MTMALQNSSIWNMQTFLGGIYHIPDYQREYSWEEDEIGDVKWCDFDEAIETLTFDDWKKMLKKALEDYNGG